MITSIALLATLVLSGPLARSEATPAYDTAQVKYCLVSIIEEVQVPAQEAGPLVALVVQDGALVKQGQLLGQIDDRQPQLQKFAAEMERDSAIARASDDIEVKYAEAALDVADAELAQNEEINRRSPGSVPATELRRLRLTKRRAELQIDKSRLDLKVAAMTANVQEAAVKLAEENIRRRHIASPIDGMVVAVNRHQGEWVSAGEPVVRVVRMDRLRVEGFVSAADFNPGEVGGRPVTVEVELARGRRVSFNGQVVFVSPQIQAGNKYRVRAEVDNRTEQNQWLLRPGTSAEMTIHLR
jgi:multidrug resistance efflux pump